LEPILPLDSAEVFFDGIFSEPRLRHPERIAIDADGDIWCGGETAEIYGISADGSGIETVASTGGFILGLAFDDEQNLYACDMHHSAVFRLDTRTGDLVHFANGMALSADKDYLYVAESFAGRVIRIPIDENGSPEEGELFVEELERVPDGLAFDAAGNLYVACYEPSRMYRVSPEGEIHLFIDDPVAHTLCHPTNCAFRGEELFTSNLGRWHTTRIEARSEGLVLP
jgi:gluconolactonase